MKMFVVLLFGAVTLLGCGNEDGSDKGASEKTEQKSDNAAGKEHHNHGENAEPESHAEHGSHDGSLVPSKNKTFYVELTWHEEKLEAGKNHRHTAMIMFHDSNKKPLGAKLTKFELRMPGMGHGTIEKYQKVVPSAKPHMYHVEGIVFNMMGEKGDWVAEITAEVNGSSDIAKVALDKEVE